MSSVSLEIINCLLVGVVIHGHMTRLEVFSPKHIFKISERGT